MKQTLAADFVLAYAVEMHMNIPQMQVTRDLITPKEQLDGAPWSSTGL
jgi:hypothetical protein